MSENYNDDISKAWVFTIIDEYQKICDSYKNLHSLKTPNFAISNNFTRKLGEWNEQSRTITLSQRLFTDGTWDDITYTLKHEIAHQIVSELLDVHSEKPHGDAFKRACKILKISPDACASFTTSSANKNNQIHEKVRKLFALGDSPNKHESERALTKAHELSLKYNIELKTNSCESSYAIRLLGPLFKRTPSYIWGITRILNEFYFVQYIRRPYDIESTKNGRSTKKIIELYGLPNNLDVAEYVYYFLLHNGEIEWKRYKDHNRLKNNRQKISFLNGLYNGFYNKLTSQNKTLAEEKSLIWLGDPGLNDFYRKRNPHIRTTGHTTKSYRNAHCDGSKVGENMTIRHGIKPYKPAFRIGKPLLNLNP